MTRANTMTAVPAQLGAVMKTRVELASGASGIRFPARRARQPAPLPDQNHGGLIGLQDGESQPSTLTFVVAGCGKGARTLRRRLLPRVPGRRSHGTGGVQGGRRTAQRAIEIGCSGVGVRNAHGDRARLQEMNYAVRFT